MIVANTAPLRAPLTVFNVLHHIWNLTPMILVHFGALGIIWTGGSLTEWVLLPVIVYVRGAFVTMGYHRYFAHRSFKTSRVGQFILAIFCCAELQQGPLWWAASHRHHHRHSDDDGDVHSPYHGGFFWAYCGWLFIPLQPAWENVRDLRRYPELVWLERFWQVPGLLLAGLAYWIGGWSFLCIGFCLSAVISFHLTFCVNLFGHIVGTRRYPTPDKSTNSLLLAVLTMGDGWHNNHHHYPHAAQAGFHKGEIDGCFRMIKFFEKIGLFWDVRRVPAHKLDPSNEISAPALEENLPALSS